MNLNNCIFPICINKLVEMVKLCNEIAHFSCLRNQNYCLIIFYMYLLLDLKCVLPTCQ